VVEGFTTHPSDQCWRTRLQNPILGPNSLFPPCSPALLRPVPPRKQGAFHERRETRGGMRWPSWVLETQALRRRPKLRRSGPPMARGRQRRIARQVARHANAGQRTRPPGLSQSKPLTPRAERRRFRRSVVTIAHALSHIAHGAMGLAEGPAFRAPLRIARGGMRCGLRARPRL
jgi:hypothetical protein